MWHFLYYTIPPAGDSVLGMQSLDSVSWVFESKELKACASFVSALGVRLLEL